MSKRKWLSIKEKNLILHEVNKGVKKKDIALKFGHKKYFLDGQTPYCPVCGVSLQLSELSSHFDLEVERLMEMNKCPSSHMEISSMHS
ncbi:hypothetical protein AVEN_41149-1, partial [Araneus ventricosus]